MSEVQNSNGFENELNILVASFDEFLRGPLFCISFPQKRSGISQNMLFRGPRGIVAGTLRKGDC